MRHSLWIAVCAASLAAFATPNRGHAQSTFPSEFDTFASESSTTELPPIQLPSDGGTPPHFDVPPLAQSPVVSYQLAPVEQVVDAKKYPIIKLSGFFQADAGWIHQSEANRAAVGDAQDGADFRRARLQALGDVWENVGYSIEFDFAFPGRPSFMDVWLEVRDVLGGANIRIGQYRQPIGMDGLTSVRELTFIERALPFALIPFRQIGGMAYGTANDEAMTWAVSVYRFPTDTFGGNVGDNGGYSFVTRLTGLPIDEKDGLLIHLGSAFSFADPSSDAVQFRSQPEFFVSETGTAPIIPAGVLTTIPAFVDTGVIPTNNVSLFGGELAMRYESAHLESELLVSSVNRINASTAVFSGAYIQAGYLLTGEVRPYNYKAGVLGRITPNHPFTKHGGCGAWEVAARWSYLDLDDSGVRGGQLDNTTWGLNWYLNQYTKFQFNYIFANLDSPVNGKSQANIAAVRAQLDF